MPKYLNKFETWLNSLKIVKQNNGPANGTLAAALVVLEKLKTNYNTDFNSHLAKGGMQIKGVSGPIVAEILRSHGEIRPFAKEGGRTNRGGPEEIKTLLLFLEKEKLTALSPTERIEILNEFQKNLVQKVRDYHNRQRIKLSFDVSLSTWHIIKSLLEEAAEFGKAGPIAQHLIGAKLQLRFPSYKISNESYSTADRPTGREGDFIIEKTIFHVTVAPMPAIYEKCNDNIKGGYRVYLLVSDNRLAGARQTAEYICGNKVAVESIETFISQNIEELSFFNGTRLKQKIKELFAIYNERVEQSEIDKSFLIELPANL